MRTVRAPVAPDDHDQNGDSRRQGDGVLDGAEPAGDEQLRGRDDREERNQAPDHEVRGEQPGGDEGREGDQTEREAGPDLRTGVLGRHEHQDGRATAGDEGGQISAPESEPRGTHRVTTARSSRAAPLCLGCR